MSTDTALRLARYFGTSPEFWVNLQVRYDLDVAEHKLRRTRWRRRHDGSGSDVLRHGFFAV